MNDVIVDEELLNAIDAVDTFDEFELSAVVVGAMLVDDLQKLRKIEQKREKIRGIFRYELKNYTHTRARIKSDNIVGLNDST